MSYGAQRHFSVGLPHGILSGLDVTPTPREETADGQRESTSGLIMRAGEEHLKLERLQGQYYKTEVLTA